MLKTVLIATDGSSHAGKAVEFGADIAAKYGAELVLVHVLLRDHLSDALRHMLEVEYRAEDSQTPVSDIIAASPYGRFPLTHMIPKKTTDQNSALQAIADMVLTEAEVTARKKGVGKITKRIEDGHVAARILEVADNVQADIIVTGARGLSDFKALMVGSVSHRLANTAPMTCIAVR